MVIFFPLVSTMEMDAYMFIDEQGNQGDTTDVVFSVTPAGSEEAATIGDVLVQGKNIRVTAQFLTAGTNVYFSSQPDDATPVNWRLDVEYSGIYAGLAIVAGDVDGASATDIYLFLMDEENPVLCVTASVRQGGELTLSADGEGKTAITMADLTGDNAENMAAVVGMDLLGGLGNLISTASQLMPEETQTITNLAMGAFGGSDEPAA